MAANLDNEKGTSSWYVYLLRCGDGSLYTGISLDPDRRLKEHKGDFGVSKGAKSLRGKKPLTLVYVEKKNSKSDALKLEHRIKRLKKADKESIVSGLLSTADKCV